MLLSDARDVPRAVQFGLRLVRPELAQPRQTRDVHRGFRVVRVLPHARGGRVVAADVDEAALLEARVARAVADGGLVPGGAEGLGRSRPGLLVEGAAELGVAVDAVHADARAVHATVVVDLELAQRDPVRAVVEGQAAPTVAGDVAFEDGRLDGEGGLGGDPRDQAGGRSEKRKQEVAKRLLDIYGRNIDQMQTKNKPVSGATTREPMPQTDGVPGSKVTAGGDTPAALKPLEKGQIDFRSPFATDKKKASK